MEETYVRKRIYELVEIAKPGDKLSAAYDVVMLVMIVAGLVPLAFKAYYPWTDLLDTTCGIVFSADYLLRLLTADYKYKDHSAKSFIRYPFSFMAIIDILSILPSFTVVNNSLRVLRLARLYRTLRVLRVFKAARYSKSVQIILRVLNQSKDALLAVCTMAVIYVLTAALVILNLEPESFSSYFEAVYWAVVSLTTVGYGDIYPVSSIGRVFTMISSLFGIAIVALPSGIITAGYMNELQQQKEEQQKLEEMEE